MVEPAANRQAETEAEAGAEAGRLILREGPSSAWSFCTGGMEDSPAQEATKEDSHTQQAHQDTTTNNDVPATPSHITLEGSTRVARLEHHFFQAEAIYFKHRVPKPRSIFRSIPDGQTPTLRSDRKNRILVYPGSFNPPHLGHTGLLWHTYLSLDNKTIAAMIIPMSTASVSRKKLTGDEAWYDDRTFKLSSHQRAQLWQDEVLSRFTWVWPKEECHDSYHFMRCMKRLASDDGFELDFPSLHGADHFKIFRSEGDLGWGTGSLVTSDIGRPVDFVKGCYEQVRLPHCSKWKMVGPGKVGHTSGVECCTECWPCRKLRAVYPEFFKADKAHHTTNGDMATILNRCREASSSPWYTKMRCARKKGSANFRPAYLIFVHSNRTYGIEATNGGTKYEAYKEIENEEERFVAPASSTGVRRLFFCHESREKLIHVLRSLVINPELLATHLGLDDR